MAAPTPDPSKIIAGFAYCWTAPADTAYPDAPDIIPYGGDWLTPWNYIGATDQGVTLNVQDKTNDIYYEESATPALVKLDTTTVEVDFDLDEESSDKLKLALGNNGTITTTAAGAGQSGVDVLNIGSDIGTLAIGFEGLSAYDTGIGNNLPIRFYIPKAVVAAKLKTAFRRAKSARMYAVTVTAICPRNDVEIHVVTAVHQ